jgi:hypothetical protein
MLRTYEATLEPSGQVFFTDLAKPDCQQRQKVLVTVVSPLSDTPSPITNGESGGESGPMPVDWRRFAGVLKDSVKFANSPLSIQKQLRKEWPSSAV